MTTIVLPSASWYWLGDVIAGSEPTWAWVVGNEPTPENVAMLRAAVHGEYAYPRLRADQPCDLTDEEIDSLLTIVDFGLTASPELDTMALHPSLMKTMLACRNALKDARDILAAALSGVSA